VNLQSGLRRIREKRVNRSNPSKPAKLRIVNPNAAGIDIGSREHFVCVGEAQPVRRFGCYTPDLHAMASWIRACGVTTIAMEATGVYWIPSYQILEAAGFEVHLVNSRHLKIVPGRKTDVQDCQWLQHLHEAGLLSGSFRPADEVVVLRTFIRQRLTLKQEAARHILRMQKALEQMNLQLHKAIDDITGQTGMAILRAIIVDGERDPETLAKHRNPRVRSSRAELVAALTGDWREEHLFALRQEWTLYHQLQEHIAECDSQIELHYQRFAASPDAAGDMPAAKSRKQETPLRRHLFRILGVDATAIPGMSPETVLSIVSEVGQDMTRWPTGDHFASWLRLCPNNHITGGRRHRAPKLPRLNRASMAFRQSAQSLARSESFLGSFYRRMRARKGGPYAVVATAAKIARLFYLVVRNRVPYRDIGGRHFEVAHHKRALRNAVKRIQALGYQLDPAQLRPLVENAEAVP
jgi:transposase